MLAWPCWSLRHHPTNQSSRPEVKTDPPAFRGSSDWGGAHFGHTFSEVKPGIHPAKSLGPDVKVGYCDNVHLFPDRRQGLFVEGGPAPPTSHRGSCRAVLETGDKETEKSVVLSLELRAQNPGSAQGCRRRHLSLSPSHFPPPHLFHVCGGYPTGLICRKSFQL